MTVIREWPTPDVVRLEGLEQRLERSLEDGAQALREIHDEKLYRAVGYKSFEIYCRERWGMGKSHAYRMIDQSKVIAVIETSPMGDVSERQLRPLAPLARQDPVLARKAWDEAVNDAGGIAPTGEQVSQAVKRVSAEPPTSPAPQWRGKPITPDLRDQIFGRGVTANKKADHSVTSVTRAVELLVESGFTPEEMKAAAHPGDVDRWITGLRHAVKQVNRYLQQLEK